MEFCNEATNLEKYLPSVFAARVFCACMSAHFFLSNIFTFSFFLFSLFFFKSWGWRERSQGEAGTLE